MANIVGTNKRKMLVVVNDNDTEQILPQTSADQVTLEDADGNYNADNAEQAFREVAGEIYSLKRGLEAAGTVKDVVNEDGTSIVYEQVAEMKKAVVKEAGKVKSKFTYKVHNKDKGTMVAIGYDGSEACSLDFDKDDFDPVYTSGHDLGVKIKDKGYAKKADVDAELEKKFDKAGGTISGNVTVSGNLNVQGKTTVVDTETLEVKDNLIVVAKDNTTALTTPAGMLVPKYDGANDVALVVDNDGMAKVGKAVLDSNGNIDKSQSDLQTLATRTGLVNGNLVQYDSENATLVDSGKKVGDFASAGQGSNADEALGKANANQEMLGKIVNGEQIVGKSTMVTTNIGSRAIADVFVGETAKVKNAAEADKVANALKISGQDSAGAEQVDTFDGSAAKELAFNPDDFTAIKSSNAYDVELATVYTTEDLSQTVAGSYTAVMVNSKGVVQAGNRSFAFIDAGAEIPADVMIGGLLFEAAQ